jgi:hypothetical protein
MTKPCLVKMRDLKKMPRPSPLTLRLPLEAANSFQSIRKIRALFFCFSFQEAQSAGPRFRRLSEFDETNLVFDRGASHMARQRQLRLSRSLDQQFSRNAESSA